MQRPDTALVFQCAAPIREDSFGGPVSNLVSAMRAIVAPSRRDVVPAPAMRAMLDAWTARIDTRLGLVCASIDPDLLVLPGGSFLALLFSAYANIKLLLPASFGGLPALIARH